MYSLSNQELIMVKGGAGFTTSALNALMRCVSTMFSVGQAVGSALRRAVYKNYC